ncbi:MAG: endolytic transglycosylase MltG [Patescibacteria group bacterium]
MKKISLLIGALLVFLAIFIAWFAPSAYIGTPGQITVRVVVPKDANTKTVAQILSDKGVITSSFGYEFYSLLDAAARNPRAGEYEVAPGASYKLIARQLNMGPTRNEITLQFIEGSDLKDWQAYLRERNVSETSITDLVGDTASGKPFAPALREQYIFLKDLPEDATLEGYLFPDTYRVWQDQLPLGIVLKQLNEFDKQIQDLEDQIAKDNRSLHEILTLASIVEKEGRNKEERRNIARIFLNRLKIGMRLQSDATVNYVTGENRPRPTLDDLEIASPYNTYRNEGLPPGPICNPGKDALEAALNPADNDYYFYLHDEEGNIYYARNAEEHKQNRYKAYGE